MSQKRGSEGRAQGRNKQYDEYAQGRRTARRKKGRNQGRKQRNPKGLSMGETQGECPKNEGTCKREEADRGEMNLERGSEGRAQGRNKQYDEYTQGRRTAQRKKGCNQGRKNETRRD